MKKGKRSANNATIVVATVHTMGTAVVRSLEHATLAATENIVKQMTMPNNISVTIRSARCVQQVDTLIHKDTGCARPAHWVKRVE